MTLSTKSGMMFFTNDPLCLINLSSRVATLPETNSQSTSKDGIPKGKDCLPSINFIQFSGFLAVSGRVILHNPPEEGTISLAHGSELKGSPYKTPFTVWIYRPFTANGPNP